MDVHVPQCRAIVVEHSLYQSSFHTPEWNKLLLASILTQPQKTLGALLQYRY